MTENEFGNLAVNDTLIDEKEAHWIVSERLKYFPIVVVVEEASMMASKPRRRILTFSHGSIVEATNLISDMRVVRPVSMRSALKIME